MALTYLDLTNIVLREVNEVPMTEQQFINSRGLQQFAKQSVNRAYLELTNSSREWPWLREKTNTSQRVVIPLLAGQANYPVDTSLYTQLDWDTMYVTDKDLVTNDPLVTREVSKNLIKLDYKEWVQRFRSEDLREDNTGNTPDYVYMSTDKETIGISPVPDKNYWLEFDAWRVPGFLENPTDELPFEDKWFPVIVSRARYYMWLFRENSQQASFAKNDYEISLAQMKHELLGQQTIRMRAV